jgi:hypothetical protein
MAEQFPAADVPKASNSTGPPTPPSGFHQPVNNEATITMVGALDKPAPTGEPAKNVHA